MIGDAILNNFVSGFAREYELEALKPNELFEHFANFAVLSRLYNGTVDLNVLGTDRSTGIDGIAIIVNDSIVTSREEIVALSPHSLEARFVFVQTKTSHAFDSGDWLKFASAVVDFFDDPSVSPPNARMSHLRDLRTAVFEQSIKMDGPPTCELYYVYTGAWNSNDAQLSGMLERCKSELAGHRRGLDEVRIVVVDSEKLKDYYRSIKQRVVKQFSFEKRAVIPKVVGVQQAYIGVLPAREYVKLITDADGNIERHLFYENVRDFLGPNPVNADIASALQSDTVGQDKFALLNNGVTIVARTITPVGDDFTLRDFQIVNGCQTSHVLFYNRKLLTDGLHLPIKLIATEDQELTSKIIKATNWQTQVTQEAFIALEPFQKRIEEFYASIDPAAHRLFYERRSKQYDALDTPKHRVITIPTQINCFVAAYLSEPQSTHRYYGELLRANRSQIFQDDHDPLPYYLCAYALFRILTEFRLQRLPAAHRGFRYHLVYGLRLIHFGTGELELSSNSRQALRQFEGFRAMLSGDGAFREALGKAHEALSAVLGRDPGGTRYGRQADRSRDFTTAFRSEILGVARPGGERTILRPPVRREAPSTPMQRAAAGRPEQSRELRPSERRVLQRQQVGRRSVSPAKPLDPTASVSSRPAASDGWSVGPQLRGTIKRFGTSGFGFIIGPDSRDFFFHVNQWYGLRLPVLGEEVIFTPRVAWKGMQADHVRPVAEADHSAAPD